MFEDLRGRVAAVTGGGRGLGLEMADALAAQGCRIALLDQDAGVEAAAAALGERARVDTVASVVDVTDPGGLRAAFDRVRDRLGPPSVLVHAAGIAARADAEGMPAAQWRRVVEVNLTGTFLTCQAFARMVFAAGGTGTIVTISSMSAFVVNTPQHQAAYNAAKAAVDQLTRSLAVEWIGRGVRVNAIAPGYVLTDMTRRLTEEEPELARSWTDRIPAGRMGRPADLRALVTLLASDESAYIVGESVVVDGGYSII